MKSRSSGQIKRLRPCQRMPPSAKSLEASTGEDLFSQRATGNSVATIAMGYVPRDVRVARLCATELTQQLRHASPSYSAEIVPFDRLKEGTVVENYRASFRSNWEWVRSELSLRSRHGRNESCALRLRHRKSTDSRGMEAQGLPSQ